MAGVAILAVSTSFIGNKIYDYFSNNENDLNELNRNIRQYHEDLIQLSTNLHEFEVYNNAHLKNYTSQVAAEISFLESDERELQKATQSIQYVHARLLSLLSFTVNNLSRKTRMYEYINLLSLCQARLISKTHISESVLKSKLVNLQRVLIKRNQTLSIDSRDLNTYYTTAGLVTCSITPTSGSIQINLQIPIRKISFQSIFIAKAHPIQFKYNDQFIT